MNGHLSGNSRTNKLNASNTLTKFYTPQEEVVKKLNYFEPDNKELLGLYQLKVIKTDAYKLEKNKNIELLKQCKLNIKN